MQINVLKIRNVIKVSLHTHARTQNKERKWEFDKVFAELKFRL